ncbi:MAG: hypothetical protein A2487_07595 [Candidatus Raymondbacteria bacterium RifOxyC12_full_50_8]|uniref:DAGKc domain-containing protein n=1 Tax=Candidatus Raymondbacteria bacterium RIFOXYD12_FULL_49_13 TaxID=1817890 RepID=A0A1F7F6K5_UNCRA|nr:MAG: hypothetical protein A2248_13355 [Candidatus Raymondbacteria bacterium RIFOXYA2_FULL_49_16]OGJ95399.1 MAG: hypothetical protein A2350_20960 [Candidatus Raymondbacteria bacterium RifOxyB12_full_50_8]OGJ99291.1 MAG: hypothetical protein A2487_07595 [Candidatus Raymondbacteria bacterium RifOxyC12_full_50_8]OGK02271.1 MAG: hypothetical protein A2519_16470 [Candidatus Raymondbacteria bacterium RIFOXYD12_FULL_49_13]OGP45115.1 MAG: hypothetical protein A2324_12000 [Candidatus Raymondbacteria b
MAAIQKITGIVNPRSASGKTAHRFRDLVGLCDKHLGRAADRINWKFTMKKGHAEELTRIALEEGASIILSVGGDGTHSEVVKGFFSKTGAVIHPAAKLAVIPQGTGGDLSRSLGLTSGAEAGVKALAQGTTIAVDAGALEYTSLNGATARTHFINITSMGVSGVITKLANSGPKWLGGKTVFALSTALAFLKYRNRPLSLSIDHGPFEEHVVASLAVANGRFFGGGMKIAPTALLNDGLFDVVCIGDFNFFGFLRHSRHVYAGAHLSEKGFWCRQARTITVRSDHEIFLDVDGENPGTLPATCTVLPRAITLFTGPGAAIS